MQTSNRTPVARRVLAALLLGLGLQFAQAEGDDALLTGSAVTEANVLDALVPKRSFEYRPAGAPVPPPKPRSASLLITFETNSAQLTAAATRQLDVVAKALKNQQLGEYAFDVLGHADPRGSAAANLSLSQLRADAVRTYLVLQHSIAPTRLKALGKGDLEPLKPDDPAAAENRRVTFRTQDAPALPGDDGKS